MSSFCRGIDIRRSSDKLQRAQMDAYLYQQAGRWSQRSSASCLPFRVSHGSQAARNASVTVECYAGEEDSIVASERRRQTMPQPLPAPATSSSVSHYTAADTRLSGRWLRLAHVGWIVLVALALGLFGASLPFALRHLHTLCTGVGCADDQLTPELLATLRQAGLSLGDYAMLLLTVNLATALIWWAVAAVIIWRKSDDWLAQLVALALVLDGATVSTGIFYDLTPAGYPLAARLLITLTGPALFLVFSLFPSGRFAPRWMRWVVLAFLLNAISHDFFSDWPYSLIGWSNLFGLLTFGGAFLLLASAQIYRYRAVSTPLERQQTKWIVVGLSGFLAVLLGTGLVGTIVPALAQTGSLYLVASVVASTLASIFIPLSFAMAILRYHLWDIDALINKALVYGSLTGLLGALYAGLIIGLESLAGLFIGQAVSNPVVLVISTLAIAALFLPVRRQIQNVIDRRFYRRKYDAEKTLAAFSATVREAPDLEQIRKQVLAVVQETMQPAHVSLWLRQPERSAEEPTQHLDAHADLRESNHAAAPRVGSRTTEHEKGEYDGT